MKYKSIHFFFLVLALYGEVHANKDPSIALKNKKNIYTPPQTQKTVTKNTPQVRTLKEQQPFLDFLTLNSALVKSAVNTKAMHDFFNSTKGPEEFSYKVRYLGFSAGTIQFFINFLKNHNVFDIFMSLETSRAFRSLYTLEIESRALMTKALKPVYIEVKKQEKKDKENYKFTFDWNKLQLRYASLTKTRLQKLNSKELNHSLWTSFFFVKLLKWKKYKTIKFRMLSGTKTRSVIAIRGERKKIKFGKGFKWAWPVSVKTSDGKKNKASFFVSTDSSSKIYRFMLPMKFGTLDAHLQ